MTIPFPSYSVLKYLSMSEVFYLQYLLNLKINKPQTCKTDFLKLTFQSKVPNKNLYSKPKNEYVQDAQPVNLKLNTTHYIF